MSEHPNAPNETPETHPAAAAPEGAPAAPVPEIGPFRPARPTAWGAWLGGLALVLTLGLGAYTLNMAQTVDPGSDIGSLRSALSRNEGRIAALEQRPAAQAADLGPVERRIAALEQRPAPDAAAPVDLSPLERRIQALEDKPAPQQPPPADLGPLEARLVALEGRPAPDTKAIEGRVAALEGRAAPDIKPLQDRLAALEQATQNLPSRTELTGISGRMDQVAGREDQIAGHQASVDQAIAGRLDGIEAKINSTIAASAALAAELPRLGQRIDGVDQKVGGVDQKIAGVDRKIAEVDQKVAGVDERLAGVDKKVAGDAQRVATIEGSVGQLPALADRASKMARLQAATQALEAGEPLGELPGAPPALAKFATVAPPTQSALRLRFPQAAAAALAASQPVVSGGFWNRVEAKVEALGSVRQGDTVLIGDPASGVISHARRTLDAGDLAGTVTTLKALRGPAADAMAPWVADAEAVLAARHALSEMAGHA